MIFPLREKNSLSASRTTAPAVPGLLQLLRKFCRHLVQGRDVLVLKLDRHLDEPVLMLLVVGMTVAAVLLVFVRMIVFMVP